MAQIIYERLTIQFTKSEERLVARLKQFAEAHELSVNKAIKRILADRLQSGNGLEKK